MPMPMMASDTLVNLQCKAHVIVPYRCITMQFVPLHAETVIHNHFVVFISLSRFEML